MAYVMTAEENYDPTLVAGFNAGSPTAPLYCYSDQQDVGMAVDFGRRKIMYTLTIASAASTTNDTGYTLWDGAVSVTNGSSVDTTTNWNLQVGEKDIDTGTVTFYPLYDVSQTVPSTNGPQAYGSLVGPVSGTPTNPTNGQNIVLNGTTWTFVTSGATGTQTNIQADQETTFRQLAHDLNGSADSNITPAWYESVTASPTTASSLIVRYKTAGTGGNSYTLDGGTYGATPSASTLLNGATGSDGTWRRMNTDTATDGYSVPVLVDPRTNNLWVHVESCFIYFLEHSNSFAQAISPLRPAFGTDNPIYPIGITSNWFLGREQTGSPSSGPNNPNVLYVVPANVSANETTMDQILSYGSYTYPADINTSYFRECLDGSGNFYVISAQATGSKDVKLYKFTAPTPDGDLSATGGGFADITPWTSSTGPNTNNSTYTQADTLTAQKYYDRNLLMFLPATNDLVAITKNTFPEIPLYAPSSYQNTFYDCTYINVSGSPTFDYHSAFVTGYMNSDWTSGTLGSAAYAVNSCRETNLFLNRTDYLFTGANYIDRWFFFDCNIVTSGAVTGDEKSILVQYRFVNGRAPQVLQVVDEQGWDSAYPTYAAFLAGTWPGRVVLQSLVPTNENRDLYISDSGFYDSTSRKFWWSGANTNFYSFDSYYTNRMNLNVMTGQPPQPPFLTLSFGTNIASRTRIWGNYT